ncbi:MAG: copper resistance protein [Hyphomicrobiales bacterium]|jgi:uncharacterized cupredoxin-like copper-binding protein|nr:copper resistance protein [Hyphomicrobiales bacterium]
MNNCFLSFLVIAAGVGLAGAATAHDDDSAGHGVHAHAAPSFDAGEPGAGNAASRRIEVVAREGDGRMFFEPARIDVKIGDEVEFVVRNEGQLAHEFVLGSAIENASHAAMMEVMPDMQHDDPNAVRVTPGNAARLVWRFSKAGEFEFACLVPGHYEAGMKGDAVVD